MINTAMILAAGRGERLRPLTDHLPKPLISLAGKPLIIHLIEQLIQANITQIVINIYYRGQQIKKALGNGKQWGINICYSEEPHALETGGGIVNALPLLGKQPFIVVSADIFTTYPFQQLTLSSYLGHLVLVPNPSWHPHGDFGLTSQHQLTAVPTFTYANIGIFHPNFFSGYAAKRFRLKQALDYGIAQHQLSGEIYTGTWFNIGTPGLLSAAEHYATTLAAR